MCLLALLHQSLPAAPLLVAANREEFYARPSLAPRLVDLPSGGTALCGQDALAGGTWLGVNGQGLLVAVTNRPKHTPPAAPRSRGLLCLDLLSCDTAEEATARAHAELESGRYAGANFVCADRLTAHVLHAGATLQTVRLTPGLHLLANGDLDDPRDPRLRLVRERLTAANPATAEAFLTAAGAVCRLGIDDPVALAAGCAVVLRGADRGTVSSTLLAWTQSPLESRYLYAPGSPDRAPYEDFSGLLRLLRTDQSAG